MAATDMPRRLPLWQRLFFAIPLFGWMAREVAYGDEENLFWAAIALIAMWGCSIMLFGVPGLYIPALMIVPVMWVLLVLMAWG